MSTAKEKLYTDILKGTLNLDPPKKPKGPRLTAFKDVVAQSIKSIYSTIPIDELPEKVLKSSYGKKIYYTNGPTITEKLRALSENELGDLFKANVEKVKNTPLLENFIRMMYLEKAQEQKEEDDANEELQKKKAVQKEEDDTAVKEVAEQLEAVKAGEFTPNVKQEFQRRVAHLTSTDSLVLKVAMAQDKKTDKIKFDEDTTGKIKFSNITGEPLTYQKYSNEYAKRFGKYELTDSIAERFMRAKVAPFQKTAK